MKAAKLCLLLLCLTLLGCEKQAGCTDPLSYTYDESAEEDDGSCRYYYGGANKGQLDIGALSNLGESFDIYFDGSFIGTLQHYFNDLDFCGRQDAIGRVVQAGNIFVEAQGNSSGKVLYATVKADPQECSVAALDYFQTTGGGGGGGGNGGGSSCNWNASTSCVDIEEEWGGRCNNSNSLEITVTNRCSGAVKVYICVKKTDGSYSNWADGNFNNGIAPGESASGYACDATGDYLVGAMPIATYVANSCPWPAACQ